MSTVEKNRKKLIWVNGKEPPEDGYKWFEIPAAVPSTLMVHMLRLLRMIGTKVTYEHRWSNGSSSVFKGISQITSRFTLWPLPSDIRTDKVKVMEIIIQDEDEQDIINPFCSLLKEASYCEERSFFALTDFMKKEFEKTTKLFDLEELIVSYSSCQIDGSPFKSHPINKFGDIIAASHNENSEIPSTGIGASIVKLCKVINVFNREDLCFLMAVDAYVDASGALMRQDLDSYNDTKESVIVLENKTIELENTLKACTALKKKFPKEFELYESRVKTLKAYVKADKEALERFHTQVKLANWPAKYANNMSYIKSGFEKVRRELTEALAEIENPDGGFETSWPLREKGINRFFRYLANMDYGLSFPPYKSDLNKIIKVESDWDGAYRFQLSGGVYRFKIEAKASAFYLEVLNQSVDKAQKIDLCMKELKEADAKAGESSVKKAMASAAHAILPVGMTVLGIAFATSNPLAAGAAATTQAAAKCIVNRIIPR